MFVIQYNWYSYQLYCLFITFHDVMSKYEMLSLQYYMSLIDIHLAKCDQNVVGNLQAIRVEYRLLKNVVLFV